MQRCRQFQFDPASRLGGDQYMQLIVQNARNTSHFLGYNGCRQKHPKNIHAEHRQWPRKLPSRSVKPEKHRRKTTSQLSKIISLICETHHLFRQHLFLEELLQACCAIPVGFHLLIAKVHQILLQVGCIHKHAPFMRHRYLQATCNTCPITCNTCPATCNTRPATCNTCPAKCNTCPATCNTCPATCNTCPATCNTCPATCNTCSATCKSRGVLELSILQHHEQKGIT